MKLFFLCTFAAIICFLGGCNHSSHNGEEEVISKRYIHKYGYDVSGKEWAQANYPGKVVTTLRNGITETACYEDGVLHGEMTSTYPHSQAIKSHSFYERGTLVKKIYLDIKGIPEKEETFLSPDRKQIICWYKSGTPMSFEEFHRTELMNAQYYNAHNEVEYKVVNGEGVSVFRDAAGKIAKKETISHGHPILSETFYPHGIPHMVTSLFRGQIHGEKKVFAPTGEPISVENYAENQLHGCANYYQNGYLYLEVNYIDGFKHGLEKHFVDGEKLVEQTTWYEGQRHGPSTVYFDGMSKTQWYYNDQPVSKEKYHSLCLQEDNIAIMNERALSRSPLN